MASPKYYVYLSKAKIDMLYQQLFSDEPANTSTSFSVNLGIVSGETTTEEKYSDNIYQKLNRVCKYIKRDVAGMESETSPYIQASLSMLWGLSKGREKATFWLGNYETDDQIVELLLIGSAGHILGSETEAVRSGGSAIPYFCREMMAEIEEQGSLKDPERNSMLPYSIKGIVRNIKETTCGDYCDFEFLAKVLLRSETHKEDGKRHKFVVASPLYVANR